MIIIITTCMLCTHSIKVTNNNKFAQFQPISLATPPHHKLPCCRRVMWNFDDFIVNTLRPKEICRHFADDISKCIFLNENVLISIKIPLKFIPKCPINNITALVQIMAWRRPGDKPLSEPIMITLLTHICATQPQWVNSPSRILTVGALTLLLRHDSEYGHVHSMHNDMLSEHEHDYFLFCIRDHGGFNEPHPYLPQLSSGNVP